MAAPKATKVKTKRGAKAPRSAFRSTSKASKTIASKTTASKTTASKTIAATTAAKTASTAKASTAKASTAKASTAKASTAKASTAKTSTAKASAAKASAAKASAAKASAAKASAAKASAAKASASAAEAAQSTSATTEAKATNGHVALGSITVPSGTLAIFDIGLVGYLPREALLPAIVKALVPSDRPLDVVGMQMGFGRYKNSWDHVAIVIGDGEVAHSRKLGEAGVDFARLACMDLDALDHWVHEESLDGKADVVFWGRDEKLLAKALRAQRTPEGYGWLDLPVDEAERKQDLIANTKSENKWLLASDFRPHSHHYHALAAARASRHGAGTLELADTRLLLFFTSWGDGVFPIYLDVDGENRPVRIRIQLATDAAFAAMAAVNP